MSQKLKILDAQPAHGVISEAAFPDTASRRLSVPVPHNCAKLLLNICSRGSHSELHTEAAPDDSLHFLISRNLIICINRWHCRGNLQSKVRLGKRWKE